MDVSTSWLEKEHRELDHALAEVEFLAERRAFAPAARRFREFKQRLEEHMKQEDADARLAAIKSEHAELAVALEAVSWALEQGEYTDFCYGVVALGKLLTAHLRAEEQARS